MIRPRHRAALTVAALLGAASGCVHDSASAPPAAPPPSLRGIDFLAQIAVMDSEPARITGLVAVTNRRETPVRLEFPDGCLALLRAYEPEVAGAPPVWDQAADADCGGEAEVLELGAGGVAQVRLREAPAEAILGDRAPGTYRFTVYLRPGGHVVEVEAGTAEL